MIHQVMVMGTSEYLSIIIRLTMAMIMGAVIGYERASKKSTAGLRTFSIAPVWPPRLSAASVSLAWAALL